MSESKSKSTASRMLVRKVQVESKRATAKPKPKPNATVVGKRKRVASTPSVSAAGRKRVKVISVTASTKTTTASSRSSAKAKSKSKSLSKSVSKNGNGVSKSKHPPYHALISEAIRQLKQRMGSSRQAIKAYIRANYAVVPAVFDASVSRALRKGVQDGAFVQSKQSFRLMPIGARRARRVGGARPMPVKRWAVEAMSESKSPLDLSALRDAICNKYADLVKDRAKLERSLKAVLSRAVKEQKVQQHVQDGVPTTFSVCPSAPALALDPAVPVPSTSALIPTLDPISASVVAVS